MATNETITWFADIDKSAVDLAGGKGANLGELTRMDIPVPPGFVIITGAYDAFVAANALQTQIIDLATQTKMDDPASFEVASNKIQALFLQGAIPDELATVITSAYQQLTANNANAVAVRSSATAEDLPGASFAGQQDTYLNIQGEAAVLEAVKQCWASLWTGRAIAYRQRQNIDPASVSLAVVVQQLIPADCAGILFTANPLNGQRDEMLINATWGLGEAIVGGEVSPDTVLVDQTNWQVVSRETATKTIMTVRTDTGTEEQAVPQAQQDQPVLDDATAIELAQYGEKIEAHYAMPMDIEWAIADGKIAILQARPITSLPPARLKDVVWEPIVPKSVWMRRQIVEHMPEPLSPLFEDLYLNQGMNQTMDYVFGAIAEETGVDFDMGMMPYGFAGTINGYAYTAASFKMDGSMLVSILRIYTQIFKFTKMKSFDWGGVVLPRYQSRIDDWKAVDLAEATDADLLRGIAEMAAADSTYWFGSALKLGLSRLMDPLFDRLLKSFLIRYALSKPRPGSNAFLRGFDSKALDAQADMEAIASNIRDSDALHELVMNTAAHQLLGVLANRPDAHSILDGIQNYLDAYGHQIYNLDFVDPTQNEDPLPMLLSLKALVQNPPEQHVRARQSKMAEDREALVARTEHNLNPLSRRLFRWFWKWTKYYGPYREHVMFYMGAAWPTVRQLARELGQRMTDAGTIAMPDDIYYLNSAEITAVIEARTNDQSLPDLAGVAQERRDLREARKLLTPLPVVPPRGEIKIGPISLSMFNPTPIDAVNEGAVLNGYAVSTGRVTAPASVIHSIADFDQMQPGSILVCTTTTPAWTPLFSQAKGLVTDVGGALAHGSIVAREYGIPAVMGTGVATERIQSGMMLIVDGDAGTVTLVDEIDIGPQSQIQTPPPPERKLPKAPLYALAAGVVVGLFVWLKRRGRNLS